MSTADAVLHEMQGLVREAAYPAEPGESVKAAINRAARRLGLSYSRIRGIWYAQARLIAAHEADALRARHREVLRQRLAAIDAEQAVLRARLDGVRQGGALAGDRDQSSGEG